MSMHETSQAEVWDDTALIDSWNEAFEEYKKYHSLAARGEKVNFESVQGTATSKSDHVPPTTSRPGQDLNTSSVTDGASEGAVTEAQIEPGVSANLDSAPTLATPALPQALAATVQNEDLKNLMMSWYYAGYYTGLYEGKQHGAASGQPEAT